MNKIKQMHLDAITRAEYDPEDKQPNYVGFSEECSKVTEQIAIEFLYWVTYECFNTRSFKYKIGIKVSGGYLPGTVEYSVEELFQEFLKTKQRK